jgi:putative FmdB family regulatory protein
MPIYEYQCTACGEVTEALQKMSDPPLTDCPACGASALRKKVSAAAFRLKGGGWYETDFKSGQKKNLAGDGEGGNKDSSAGKEGAKDGAKESPKDAAKGSTGGADKAGADSGKVKAPAATPGKPKSDR